VGTTQIIILGVIAVWFSVAFGWWMYRQTPTAEDANEGALVRSLWLYFWIAGTLGLLLNAVFWLLVLFSVL
jgi:hypothetical protein